MVKRLFTPKAMEAFHDELSHHSQLKRVLGPVGLVALGVGAIIGAGIFVITGQAAAQYAGPAITLSFIVSGIACAFAGLCYAEFASMIPISGSAYSYAYATLGEFLAWFIGWDLILEYLVASSAVAVGWSGYLVSFLKDFGIVIPDYLAQAPLAHIAGVGWKTTGALMNLPAMAILGFVSFLLILGIRESTRFNAGIVILKIVVLILFVAFGLGHVNPANWTPFIPDNTGQYGSYGWSGILRGAGVVFFAYIGFDAVSTAAQEAKNPQKDMPIGILGSLAVSTVFYVLVSLVLTGIVNYKSLLVPDPIAVAINTAGTGLLWLRPLVKIGAIAGISSVLLVMIMGQPRIFYAMSRDGLLPPLFGKVHPKFRTPWVATTITGVVAMVIAGVFPISVLGELVSIGTLAAFCIVNLGVLVLRYRRPELHRPFKTPFVPIVPILGAAAALLQMVSLPVDTWLRLIVWMLIGFAIYFFYGIKHSKHNVVQ